MFWRKKVKDQPNPWLKIPHNHNWLDASDGKELVCGDCGLRKANPKYKTLGDNNGKQ